MSGTRCVDGRTMRHDPQNDDPYLETDIGECLECDGKGCYGGVDEQNPANPDDVDALWTLIATLRASLRVMLALMESDVDFKYVSCGETRQKVMKEARSLVPAIKV